MGYFRRVLDLDSDDVRNVVWEVHVPPPGYSVEPDPESCVLWICSLLRDALRFGYGRIRIRKNPDEGQINQHVMLKREVNQQWLELVPLTLSRKDIPFRMLKRVAGFWPLGTRGTIRYDFNGRRGHAPCRMTNARELEIEVPDAPNVDASAIPRASTGSCDSDCPGPNNAEECATDNCQYKQQTKDCVWRNALGETDMCL